MELSYQEKGDYFRGLLILIGKDNMIEEREKRRILEIAQKFGFDRSFCEGAVSDFLENQFISLDPPKFSTSQIAEKFLDDAINLSIIDNDFHTDELEWLEKVASANNIENTLLDYKIRRHVLDFKERKLVTLPTE